jgi:hypothetical protein
MAKIHHPKPLPEDETWLRQWTLPFEDCRSRTPIAWRGEHRWFCSPNIVALEDYRSPGEWGRIRTFFWPRR